MGTRLKSLSKVWVYSPIKEKINGEYSTSWKFKTTAYLNLQQDLNELDRNSSGEIDYDTYKGRTRKKYDINKNDGIYIVKNDVMAIITEDFLEFLTEGDSEIIHEISEGDRTSADEIKKPEYIVAKAPQIGRTITYTLNKYLGE